MDNKVNQDIFSAMQTKEPLARFKKTILGKVHVITLNPFDDKPENVILEGDPRKDAEGLYIEIWSPKALMFFKKMNKKHFDEGRLTEMEKTPELEESPNTISDSEIEEILNKPFLALSSKLDRFTSEAPIMRFLTKAQEMEKSEKVIKRIREALELVEQG